MGPSYACAMLLHRLNPIATAAPDPGSTHPPDAVRAAVVLDVLTLLTKGEPDDSRYRTTCDHLGAAWRDLQQLAPETAWLKPEQGESVMTQVRLVLNFLSQQLKPLRYEWPSAGIRELAEALRANRAPNVGDDNRIRDVLNAAWRLRVFASVADPLPAHVETSARALIGRMRGGTADA